MIFDDLEIDSLIHDGKLYVCVSDLKEHLSKAVHEFSNETEALSHVFKMTQREKAFVMGLINGMYNVVMMLTQSQDEYKLGQINTIDELLEKFNDFDEKKS
jgi:cell division protein ZapA (FtsZ GTPase activity inhibitor)